MQQGPVSQDKDGNPAFEQRHACVAGLYQKYAPALFEYLRRHVGTLDDAEDLLTEVFIGALQHDLTEMSADEQRAWLWKVARNKINDSYRRAGRRQYVPLDMLEETFSHEMTPEQLALWQEETASLRNYLKRLSPAQREVLELRFVGGLRCTEIAALLKKREGAVRSILARALNELRKSYGR